MKKINISIDKMLLLKRIELEVRTICGVPIGDCSLTLPWQFCFRFSYKGVYLGTKRVVLTQNDHMETYLDLPTYNHDIQSSSVMLSDLRISSLTRLHNLLSEIIKGIKSHTIIPEKVYTILKVDDKKC